MQHWAADHQAMMDVRLGGMKEALKLTANQYPLWEIFETAVRNGDKARMDDMREMMQNRERMSPSTISTKWPAIWLDAPPNLRRSPRRPNLFTPAWTIHRSANSDCLAARC
jgi:hypothetical protein